jgi:hypothetical protein
MTSQSPEKSNVARRNFLRMPGAGLVAARANAVRKRRDRIKYIAVHAEGAAAFNGFARLAFGIVRAST